MTIDIGPMLGFVLIGWALALLSAVAMKEKTKRTVRRTITTEETTHYVPQRED